METGDLPAFIARRLRELCENKMINPARLAELSGVSRSAVSTLLSGKCGNVRVGTLWKLCAGVDIGIEEFWRGKESREYPRIPENTARIPD